MTTIVFILGSLWLIAQPAVWKALIVLAAITLIIAALIPASA